MQVGPILLLACINPEPNTVASGWPSSITSSCIRRSCLSTPSCHKLSSSLLFFTRLGPWAPSSHFLTFYVESTQRKLGKKTRDMVHEGQHYRLVAYYREEGTSRLFTLSRSLPFHRLLGRLRAAPQLRTITHLQRPHFLARKILRDLLPS